MGDHDQRRRTARPGARPARRPPRRRGGWSARRGRPGRASSSSSAASEQRRRSPPESPMHRPVERDPGEQHLDDLAGARRRPPTRGPARPAEHGLAHGVGVVERVALVQVADRAGPRLRRDPAAVGGSSSPVSTCSSVVLPSPLRPTTPIRSPADDAEARPRSSSGRTPYALETRSRLTRLASAAQAYVHHVGAGDRPVRDEDDAAGRGRRQSAAGDRARVVGGLAQEHAGRAGAGHAARAARRRRRPRSISAARSGRRSKRGLLEVVVQGRGQPASGRRRPAPRRIASGGAGHRPARPGAARRSAR